MRPRAIPNAVSHTYDPSSKIGRRYFKVTFLIYEAWGQPSVYDEALSQKPNNPNKQTTEEEGVRNLLGMVVHACNFSTYEF